MKKPRADSKLKTLPVQRQEEIFARLRDQTYSAVRESLAQEGLIVSEAALAEFWQWWHLKRRWDAAEKMSREIAGLLASANGESPSVDQVEAYGQAVFLSEAIAVGGDRGRQGFVEMTRLRLSKKELEQRERMMALQRQKFEFDAAEAVQENLQKLRIIQADRSLHGREKIDALRLYLFGPNPFAKDAERRAELAAMEMLKKAGAEKNHEEPE